MMIRYFLSIENPLQGARVLQEFLCATTHHARTATHVNSFRSALIDCGRSVSDV